MRWAVGMLAVCALTACEARSPKLPEANLLVLQVGQGYASLSADLARLRDTEPPRADRPAPPTPSRDDLDTGARPAPPPPGPTRPNTPNPRAPDSATAPGSTAPQGTTTRPPTAPPTTTTPPTLPTPEPAFTEVRLAAGQTLYGLCRDQLGNGARWREVAKLNGWSEAQAGRLSEGQSVKLPRR